MKDSPETVLFAKLEDSMKLFYSSKSLKNQISYNFGMTQTLNIPKLISRKICVYFIIGQIIYHSKPRKYVNTNNFLQPNFRLFFVRLLNFFLWNWNMVQPSYSSKPPKKHAYFLHFFSHTRKNVCDTQCGNVTIFLSSRFYVKSIS